MNLMEYGRNALKVRQREIILINFPFSDLTGMKVRPALVVSSNRYNKNNLDAVVLAITSNLSPHAYKIPIEMHDLDNGSLPLKSAIRVDKPFSVLQSKVLKIQAKVTIAKLKEVKLLINELTDE
jgi:mRNA interferase MazF